VPIINDSQPVETGELFILLRLLSERSGNSLLTFRTISMQKTSSERRSAERYEQKEALDLKIVFSSENPNLLGKTLCGSTLDVSASGLRIELNQKIKMDSVLDVWVTLKDSSRKYFLTGNVRWCNEMEVGGYYQVGVVLRERSDTVTDLEAWRQVFKVKQ